MKGWGAGMVFVLLLGGGGCSDRGESSSNFTDRVVFENKHGKIMLSELVASRRSSPEEFAFQPPTGVASSARMLHQSALEQVESGDLDTARYYLNKARDVAPTWPYPVYDLARVEYQAGNLEAAARCLEEVLELAPQGFFETWPMRLALQGEQRGEYARGTWALYQRYMRAPVGARDSALLDQLEQDAPAFGPVFRERAVLAENDVQRAVILEQALNHPHDPETHGTLVVMKAQMLSRQQKHQAAVTHLGELLLDPESTAGARQKARSVLQMLVAPPPPGD